VIRFACQCGTPYTLADHLAGRTFRCTKCNATITLPAAAAPPAGYAPPAPRYEGAEPEGARWGSSGTLPAVPAPKGGPPAKKWGGTGSSLDLAVPGSDDAMDAPTVDPDRDAPKPKPKKKTTAKRPVEKLEIPDKLDLVPEDESDLPTEDPDRDDVLLAKAALEGSSDLDNSLERSSETKKKKKKNSARIAKTSDRVKKRSTSDRTSVAMECPACGEMIARVATSCPSCGVPLTGGKRGGLTDDQKQLLNRMLLAAGVVVALVGVFLVVKMLRDDTGGGSSGGTPKVVKNTPPKDKPPPKEDKPKDPPKDPNEQKPPPPRDRWQDPPKDDKPNPKDTPKDTPPRDTPPRDTPPRDTPPPSGDLPAGPFKDDVLALKGASDLASVEKKAKDLGAKDGFAAVADDYMKAGDSQLRGRITRALLSRADHKAALDRAWASEEVEVIVPAIETSATDDPAGVLDRVRAMSRGARDALLVAEAYTKCLLADPTVDSVGAARDYMKDKDLGTRLSVLLLAGGDGAGLALAPEAFSSDCQALRKAAKKGLEAFLQKKGEKDPVADAEGARNEWQSLTNSYAPIREKLEQACADGLGKNVSADTLAMIVDARIDLVSRRHDVLPLLPIFMRDSAAKTGSAGACFIELIPRLCQGQSPADVRKILNDVIDTLGEDSRVSAAFVTAGCLRAADADCAASAAKLLDKGVTDFREAASFPDLVTPCPPPKKAFDSPDPYALIAAASFRGDAKNIEGRTHAVKQRKEAEEALARLGSHEVEKHLLLVVVGKDKLNPAPSFDVATLLGEIATHGYVGELKSYFSSGKDFDHSGYGNLARSLERCCAASDADAILKLADLGKEKADTTAAQYYLVAANTVGSSDGKDAHEARGKVFHAVKALGGDQPKPGKKPPKDPPPGPKPGTIDLSFVIGQAAPATMADGVHDDAAATIQTWLKSKSNIMPQNEDLERFLKTCNESSLKKDQELLQQAYAAVALMNNPGYTQWVFRALARVGGVGLDGCRNEVMGSRTAMGQFRAYAAVILGRAKDSASADAIEQLLDVLSQKRLWDPNDAGVIAGLSLCDSRAGGEQARKLLQIKDLPPEIKEGCFFALAKSGADEDTKVLTEWAKKPDESVRALVAGGIAYAVRSPGGASSGNLLIERLRLDPSALVRAEAAIAYMERQTDVAALLDGALALDCQDKELLKKQRGGILHLAATGDMGNDTTLFLDLCHAYDHCASKFGVPKLEARPGINQGRFREIIRTARQNARGR
jgi:hypothetical protein